MKSMFAIFASLLVLWTAIGINEHRLPKNVIPYFYNITTDIHPDDFWFNGITEIQVDVVEESDNITLHAVEMTIVTVRVYFGEMEIDISDRDFHKSFQFLTIKFPRKLKVGKYKIEISYQGNLSRNLKGLYATNFTPVNEYPRSVVVTNFETMDARKAFPCFDEPALKAQFRISVVRDQRHISLSNMPLLDSTVLENGRICDTFETTPKMSTYLVAFAVCEFDKISYPRGNIYTRPTYIEQVSYAASITNPIIGAIESYLEIMLPLKKLDIIVVRHMSGGGGLENWGLILLSEKRAYYEKGVSTQREKQELGTLIAHECVHQWFGDLVTLDWWNNLWLNEGIATFVHFTILQRIIPEWRLKEQAILHCLITGVELDSLVNARSISEKADEQSDYDKYFDNISYKKAAAVLQILESVIGEAIFRKGLQIFILNHKYSTATGRDLWNAFQKAIEEAGKTDVFPKDLDVATVMESWEKQAGIPVLNVIRNYSAQYIEFSQERYLLKKIKNFTSSEWYIPITCATKSQANFKNFTPVAWLEPTKRLLLKHHINQDDWLIVNKQAFFYYLVNYDERNWKLIASTLNREDLGNIPALTRGKLLYDAFMLAASGRLKYSVVLELIKYLEREKDYIVFNAFFYVLDFFYSKFSELETFHYLQNFLAKALQPSLEHLGINENKTISADQQHIDILNRVQVIKWACFLGNKLCRNLTTERLTRSLDTISVNLREVLFCAGLRGASVKLWRTILQKGMEDADMAANKGLGCSENKDSLDIYMDESLKWNMPMFHRVYQRGAFGVNYVLDYLVKHWKRVNESISEPHKAQIIKELSDRLTTQEQLTKLKYIEKSLAMPGLNKTFANAFSRVEINIKWVSLHANDINQWIRKELVGGGSSVAKVSLCAILLVLFVNL